MSLEYTNRRFPKVEKFLQRYDVELDDIQTYFPCTTRNYDEIKINKWTTIGLDYHMLDIIDTCPGSYKGTISDSSGTMSDVNFHIKCTPIIEPTSKYQKEYPNYHYNPWLPFERHTVSNLCKKINDIQNTAYTDTTCSILLSKLRHNNESPHFGYVYGIYNGIVSDYEEDITDEYTMYKSEKWFKRCNIKKIDNPKTQMHAGEVFKDLNKCNLDDYAVDVLNVNFNKDEEESDDATYKIIHNNLPVQVVLMEKCDITLDELLKNLIERVRICSRFRGIYSIRKMIFAERLRAWLFQVCAALSVANKSINFVHNDLHVQNIMGRKTNDKFLYYRQGDILYKVPTYGYVMQIIDYGRSTYTLNGVPYFGDVFNEEGEAGGQYTLPNEKKYGTKKSVNPNPAFDLARLACSFVEDLDDILWPTVNHLDGTDIGRLFKSWTFDDRDDSLLDISGFELYIHIAKCFRKRKPYKQTKHSAFKKYECFDETIDNVHILPVN